jgi:CheY-like chemotaxis protein
MDSALKVLIVEDNADLGFMLAVYLCEAGFAAGSVTSAEEALERLAADPVDVLMTDVSLPGMSGIALATAVAQRWPHTGLVISSGYGSALDLEYFPPDLAPLVRLVPKPCDLAQLPQVLQDAAARVRTRAA